MNIFNKIGNKLEEDKKKREEFEKRYWKLSAIERIDYDNKVDRIEKSFYGFFPLTSICIKYFFIILILFVSTFYLTGNVELSHFFRNITIILANFIWIFGIIDFVCLVASSDKNTKRFRDLNKRFKLDTRNV